jgi:16S rRNA (uracil1498-N3)-methyltransferase
MARFAARLYVDAALDAIGGTAELSPEQAHYLRNVLRLEIGATLALFNGRDGEVLAELVRLAKNGATATVRERSRPQTAEPDLWLLFAPLKRERIDLVAEKASELGVARLLPVFTRHTVMTRVNVERLRAHVLEAAEQCERLTVPIVDEAADLDRVLGRWPTERRLFVCAEAGPAQPIAEAVRAYGKGPAALLIGPEGGFNNLELDALHKLAFVTPVRLGPRLLRAETAAIAALSVLQAVAGDWV